MNTNQKQKKIPTDWRAVKLGDLLDFKNGLNKEKEFFGKGTPIVNYTDVYKKTSLKSGDVKGLVTVSKSELVNNSAKKGDVFFTRTSETLEEIGMASVLLEQIDNCVFSGYVLRGRPKIDDVLPKYWAYSLRTPSIRNEIKRKSSMTTRALTSGKSLSAVYYPYPPQKEQERIINILDTWDRAIEIVERKIALKREVKKGLMQRLLTSKLRLPGFSGEWTQEPLGQLCTIKTGKKDVNEGNPKGQYPFFSCAKQHTYSDSYSFDTEAILIAGNGEVGHSQYYNGKFEAYQRTYVLSDFQTNALYLSFYLSHYFKQLIESQKQIGPMSYIKIGMLTDFFVRLPYDSAEADAIADVLVKIDKELDLLTQKLSIRKEQKKYLLNNLVTGAIRTPENL
jgi:type I restriction enzyme, S subunit